MGMFFPSWSIFTGQGMVKTNNFIIQHINDSWAVPELPDGRGKHWGLFACWSSSLLYLKIFSSTFLISYWTRWRIKWVNHLWEDMYEKILKLLLVISMKKKGDILEPDGQWCGWSEGSVVGTLEGWIRDPMTIIITLNGVIPWWARNLRCSYWYWFPILGLLIGRITKSLKNILKK